MTEMSEFDSPWCAPSQASGPGRAPVSQQCRSLLHLRWDRLKKYVRFISITLHYTFLGSKSGCIYTQLFKNRE